MFEDSPRRTKRQKTGNEVLAAENVLAAPVDGQSVRKPTPGTNATRHSAVKGAATSPEAGKDDGTATGLTQEIADARRVTPTYQPQTHGECNAFAVNEVEDGMAPHLPDTPSKVRVSATGSQWDGERQVLQELEDLAAEPERESGASGLTIAEQGGLGVSADGERNGRSSGRQRKITWKLAQPDTNSNTPARPKRTPASQKRAQKQAAVSLSPVIQETVLNQPATSPAALAAAALNEVSNVAVTPTPTPKKRGRPRKNPEDATPTPKKRVRTAKPKQVGAPPQIEVVEPSPTDAELSAQAPTAQLAINQDDELAMEVSPFKTTAPNLTPTPRKRGRPPKAKFVDEFGFQAIDPLASSSKKPRTTLAQDSEDVDPLAAFTRRDPAAIAARKGAKEKTTIKAVSWQDFKDIEDRSQPKTTQEEAFGYLQRLLEDEAYHAPLQELKSAILQTLTGKRRMPLQGLDDEYQKVRQLVEQTVVAGEGNSMFVIGPRGSGKSALLDSVIKEMSTKHSDEFHVIRLNGFIHTDDKLALREIWRQLGIEMDLEDSMLDRSNYADKLSSILAVMSHTEEQLENQMKDVGDAQAQISRSVVFVIDEFDLFTSHARQTLLYNLFDIAQARKAPIAVLGLTTRVDVTESLEKRVKSRFSHRTVFLPRPKSFPAYQEIILAALTSDHGNSLRPDDHLSNNIDPLLAGPIPTLHAAWNAYIKSLFHSSSPITAVLRHIYATSRSVPTGLTTFLLPIASLSATELPLPSTFLRTSLLPADSKLDLLPSLSDLELALLISAARLDIILNVDTCNFNMAYDEYTTLAERARITTSASGIMAMGGSAGGRTWSRETSLGAWERLEILELIMPLATAGYGAGAGLADVGRAGKLMRVDVSMEEIRYCGVELSAAMLRWCKEI